MALSHTVETEFGVTASYWNIGAVQEDFKGKGTQVTLYGYANKDAFTTGKQPLSAAQVTLAGEDYVAGADRNTLYSIIKQRSEFAGATDC